MGIDVGGTKSAAVLVDDTGSSVARHWTEHHGQDEGRLRDIILASIDALLVKSRITTVAGFGIAVSGLVGNDRSMLVRAPSLGERSLDLGRTLSERLGSPVFVVNDANATLVGHRQHAVSGVGPTTDQHGVTVLLTLGTGTGGAIMAGDRLVTGEHGFAAELGHILVDADDARTCLCGSRGCVEQFASGRGMVELAAVTPPPRTSRELLKGSGASEPYSTRDIIVAAQQGDPWAVGLLTRSGHMLGRAVAILCATLDPGAVIVGGSFGHATAAWLLPAAIDELQGRRPYANEWPQPRLAMDAVGPYAAATGAALLAAAELGLARRT